MAESRREKRFLRLSIFCIGRAANAASAAITGPSARGRCRPLDRGDDGSLAWVDAGPWFRAMPALGLGAITTPWIRAFILTASKSKINDETPLNSGSLRGRSSLFRDIVVLR